MRKKTIRITWENPVRLEDKEKWSQNDNVGVIPKTVEASEQLDSESV